MVRIVGGRGMSMQVRQTGNRKLFGKERKQVFLQWFAATGNLGFAAGQAGVTRQTVSKHRLSDPDFAEAYQKAIALGVPDLQARLQAWLLGRPKLDVNGNLADPDDADFDPQLALQMFRELSRLEKAPGLGQALKRGRAPRVATNEEVRAALVKALRAYGERVEAEENPPRHGEGDHAAHGGGGVPQGGEQAGPCESRSPLRQRFALPPPRSGED